MADLDLDAIADALAHGTCSQEQLQSLFDEIKRLRAKVAEMFTVNTGADAIAKSWRAQAEAEARCHKENCAELEYLGRRLQKLRRAFRLWADGSSEGVLARALEADNAMAKRRQKRAQRSKAVRRG